MTDDNETSETHVTVGSEEWEPTSKEVETIVDMFSAPDDLPEELKLTWTFLHAIKDPQERERAEKALLRGAKNLSTKFERRPTPEQTVQTIQADLYENLDLDNAKKAADFLDRYKARIGDTKSKMAFIEFFDLAAKLTASAEAMGIRGATLDAETGEVTVTYKTKKLEAAGASPG
jgi:hypothetical protein